MSRGGRGERRGGGGRRSGIAARCSYHRGGPGVLDLVGAVRGGSWRACGRGRGLGEVY